jgi:protein involved in polysaccharide export with SLBB domain
VASGPVVYLEGEFKNPRPYRIPNKTKSTLISLILSCGGVTNKADLTAVRVMRMAANKGVVEEINVQKILDGEGNGLASDITLNEGDVVVVPSIDSSVVYLTGRVRQQGAISLKRGEKMSVYDAILRRGGFARFADIKNVYVLRSPLDGGVKIRIPVNFSAIQKGRSPDILLEMNDIVVVPEKFFSF